MMHLIYLLVAANTLAQSHSPRNTIQRRGFWDRVRNWFTWSKDPAQPAPRELVFDILDHAGYAAVAYCDEEQRKTPNRNTRMLKTNTSISRSFFKEEHDTHALLYINTEVQEIVLTFKGPDNLERFDQMMSQESFDYSRGRGAKVQKATFQAYRSIRKGIVSELYNTTKSNHDYRVVIIGHSLGGSLATLMAPYVSRKLNIEPKDIRVITYNQPRVGNKAFAEYYNSLGFNFTRVTNKNDMIPAYPLVEHGWSHVHREVYIDDKDNYFLCSDTALEDANCSANENNRIKSLVPHGRIGKAIISPRGCHGWDFIFQP